MLKSLLSRCPMRLMICIAIFSHAAIADDTAARLQAREREIEVIAREFESTMISRSLKSMYEGVKTDPIAGGGSAEGIYRELLLEEYAKIISRGGGFNLLRSIERDIKRGDTTYQNLLRAQNGKEEKQFGKQ